MPVGAETARRRWQQLEHLRFNIGCSWLTVASGEVSSGRDGEDGWLQSLRSLHLDVACRRGAVLSLFEFDRVEKATAEGGRTLQERMELALRSARQLQRLTITADPSALAKPFQYKSGQPRGLQEGKDQRFDLPLSLLCLPSLAGLTYLHLDCPDMLNDDLIFQLLSNASSPSTLVATTVASPVTEADSARTEKRRRLHNDVPWRNSLTHLGLYLHPPQLRAATVAFSHTAFPALRYCHIAQVAQPASQPGHAALAEAEIVSADEKAVRRRVGSRLWCDLWQLVAGRAHEQWAREQDVRVYWPT